MNIVNSKNSPDLWGLPNVSRIVVGGSFAEYGDMLLGRADSVDIGNFAHEETAVVLPGSFAFSGVDPSAQVSTYLRPGSDTKAFVARAIGNIVAHEAGHRLGAFHTDTSNWNAQLMDRGGNYTLQFGVGRDGIGGTSDDVDVDFGTDVFDLPLRGSQNSRSLLSWALTARTVAVRG